MPLRNIVRKDLITCAPEASITEIAQLMERRDVGAVLVVEGKLPLGLITDRDLVLRCLTKTEDVSLLSAEEVMSAPVETVSDEDGIYDVVKKMRKAGIRRVVVVNALGEAAGLLSFDDVFELLAEEIGSMKEVIQPRKSKLENIA
jgi:CBS domain-containing protein